jgi:hypothetical protein
MQAVFYRQWIEAFFHFEAYTGFKDKIKSNVDNTAVII